MVAAAAKAVVSALATLGGWAVLLVALIVVIVVAAIAASPFGIFISDEAADNDSIPISAIVAECNMELSNKLDDIENAQTNPTENEKSTSAQNSENAINQKNCEYIGNANTKKFHYPECGAVSQMKEKNKVYLNCTRNEAIKDGYTPCGRCNP